MVFLPFFMIISLIYLIKISSLTSKISLSLSELFLLYSYSIPEIIYYTIPISFVASTATLFSKLSTDNELIALFSLGLDSKYMVKKLNIIAILFTTLLLSISFLAIPMSKQYYSNFKEDKKSKAKLNLMAGELGQKFGSYYIYIESKDKDNKNFNNMVIYNKSKKNQEEFFAAKKGSLKHINHATVLELKDGYGYTYYKDALQEAKYKTIDVYQSINGHKTRLYDIISYWKHIKNDIKLKQKALFMIFVSFIPLISVYLIASFTIINPRYQKNHTFIVIFVTTLLLYTIASVLHKQGNIYMVLAFVSIIFVFGKILFKKRVQRYF
jgi:lipopolysaccharide export system permease protein